MKTLKELIDEAVNRKLLKMADEAADNIIDKMQSIDTAIPSMPVREPHKHAYRRGAWIALAPHDAARRAIGGKVTETIMNACRDLLASGPASRDVLTKTILAMHPKATGTSSTITLLLRRGWLVQVEAPK